LHSATNVQITQIRVYCGIACIIKLFFTISSAGLEDSSLLGCYTLSTGLEFLTFIGACSLQFQGPKL